MWNKHWPIFSRFHLTVGFLYRCVQRPSLRKAVRAALLMMESLSISMQTQLICYVPLCRRSARTSSAMWFSCDSNQQIFLHFPWIFSMIRAQLHRACRTCKLWFFFAGLRSNFCHDTEDEKNWPSLPHCSKHYSFPSDALRMDAIRLTHSSTIQAIFQLHQQMKYYFSGKSSSILLLDWESPAIFWPMRESSRWTEVKFNVCSMYCVLCMKISDYFVHYIRFLNVREFSTQMRFSTCRKRNLQFST